jgi:membrane associated rhomboid family serine protease
VLVRKAIDLEPSRTRLVAAVVLSSWRRRLDGHRALFGLGKVTLTPDAVRVLRGFWFLQQFLMGAASLGVQTAETGRVAWWAHVGGFVAGVVLVRVFGGKRRAPERDGWYEDRRRWSY